MNRLLCSMSFVAVALITFAVAGGEAHAADAYWGNGNIQYGNSQFGYNEYDYNNADEDPRPKIMQDGLTHGKQWGHGPCARGFARWEDRFFPSSVNGYWTKTRCGPFSTIR